MSKSQTCTDCFCRAEPNVVFRGPYEVRHGKCISMGVKIPYMIFHFLHAIAL